MTAVGELWRNGGPLGLLKEGEEEAVSVAGVLGPWRPVGRSE